MGTLLERIMDRYGTAMVWRNDAGETSIRAFLQPVTARSWQKMKREMFPVGEVPIGVYVYMGSMAHAVEEGDWLLLEDRMYHVRRMEIIYDAQGGAYRWGLCARKGR